jgi:hypothetical protein
MLVEKLEDGVFTLRRPYIERFKPGHALMVENMTISQSDARPIWKLVWRMGNRVSEE